MEGVAGGACGTYGEKRNAYRILVVKPERKGPFGRPERRWDGNIKMDERNKIVGREMDLSGRVACCCECGNEPSDFMKCGDFLD
jgi:hypothetical protein